MPGAAMGIVVAPPLQRGADDIGYAVQLEGMTPISTRLDRNLESRRGRTTTPSLMSQVHKPHEHERPGLAVPKQSVAMITGRETRAGHEVSHRVEVPLNAPRGSGPSGSIRPPQAGQMSSGCPVS